MVPSFFQAADILLRNGGHVSYEWPRYRAGWIEEPLTSWIIACGLFSVSFPGCSVGVTTE